VSIDDVGGVQHTTLHESMHDNSGLDDDLLLGGFPEAFSI
jgi:hypothetical protein